MGLPQTFPHPFCCPIRTSCPLLIKMVDDTDWNSNPHLPTLRQVRERLNMTQEEFARELGTSLEPDQ